MRNEKFQNGPDANRSFLISHFSFLQRCIELAQAPGAAVEPNPRVGAVVVHAGKIIGEGAHLIYGGPHAEVNAIGAVAAPSLLQESILYVSLEPCNHHGKTPPCTQLILDTGIPRVVIGALDPNPQMQGKSVAFLRSKGVEVEICPDSQPFIALNRHFYLNQQLKRPYIVLKWAESADGLISGTNAAGQAEPRAISGSEMNRRFHWLRHDLQAIWIGRATAAIDNPSLATRLWPGRNPLRIVMDQHLALPSDLQVFKDQPTLVINALRTEEIGNVRYWQFENSYDIPKLLESLYLDQKIGSVLVEGGREFLQQFLDCGIWDEMYRCVSPLRLQSGTPAPRIPKMIQPLMIEEVGIDKLEYYEQGLSAK